MIPSTTIPMTPSVQPPPPTQSFTHTTIGYAPQNRHIVQPLHKTLQEELHQKQRSRSPTTTTNNKFDSLFQFRYDNDENANVVRKASSSSSPQQEQQKQEEKEPELLSSPWWIRLTEWSNIYKTYKNDWNNYNGKMEGIIPETRRAHSATVYTIPFEGVVSSDAEVVDGEIKEEENITGISELVDVVNASAAAAPSNNVSNSAKASNNDTDTNVSNSKTAVIGTDAGNAVPNDITNSTTISVTNTTLMQQENGNNVDTTNVDSIPPSPPSNTNSTTNNNNNNNNNQTRRNTKEPSNYNQEYMIITGGFTDTDWTTFPIWAFDMTSSVLTGEGQWRNLNPDEVSPEDLFWEDCDTPPVETKEEEEGDLLLWESAKYCPPPARIGHVSWVYKGYLYVFGGMLYDDTTGLFHSERLPFVYRIRIDGKLPPLGDESDNNNHDNDDKEEDVKDEKNDDGKKKDGWYRIVPNINVPLNDEVDPNTGTVGNILSSSSPSASASPYDLLLRGEIQGGLWKNQDKVVIYGGLSVKNVDTTPSSSSASSTRPNAGTPFGNSPGKRASYKQIDTPLGDVWSYDLKTDTWEQMDITTMMSSSSLPLEENQGEMTQASSTSSSTLKLSKKQEEENKLAFNNEHPRPRTAHAATIVNNEFIIYGGMAKIGTDPWRGSTEWEELSDVWIFDLLERKWTERKVEPDLKRSYHSLVGWEENIGGKEGDGGASVASFGGYTLVDQPMGEEEVAFVFDDTLISHPPSCNLTSNESELIDCERTPAWMKATWPIDATDGVSHRLEHAAVLSEVWGTMYVWGGRFQDTRQIDGMWMLNVAGKNAQVAYHRAEPDGLETYEATVAFMHLLLAMVMFLSMMVTAMCGLVNRDGDEDDSDDEAAGDARNGQNRAVFSGGRGRRRGLRQDVIDTLPVKKYCGVADENVVIHQDSGGEECNGMKIISENERNESQTAEMDHPATVEPVSSEGLDPIPVDGSRDDHSVASASNDTGSSHECEEDECCPICLVEYEVGEEVRTLPCGHEFHKECVDPWLGNNASCPACRHSLKGLSSTSRSAPARVQVSLRGGIVLQFLMNQQGFWLSRYGNGEVGARNGNDSNANNGSDDHIDTDELDLSYISSLELMEEVVERDSRNMDVNTDNNGDIQPAPAGQQQIEGRTRIMRMRGSIAGRRPSRRSGRRRGIRRGSRMVPLNDPLDPSGQIQDGETVIV